MATESTQNIMFFDEDRGSWVVEALESENNEQQEEARADDQNETRSAAGSTWF